MEINNAIYQGNRCIAAVIIGVYIVLFVFLLQQNIKADELTHTSTEVNENIENNNYYISGVPIINQFPELPTGCEVTSAAMLLNYYGINVSKEALADEISKAPLPIFRNDRIEGESPYEYFIGNPRESKAFGTFNQPIFNLISDYKIAENMTGCDFSQVINQVKSGHPVMVWITRELMEVEYQSSWYVKDEIFWWPKGEHTVVVIGVDDHTIIVNDPYNGEEKYFELESFKRIWETLGRQAITISE